MANTGYKQAIVAYKVRTTDGAPLDINGNPTSESGLKQAIALLIGTANPNPAIYEIQFYFSEDAVLTGNPSFEYDPEGCATGFIVATPSTLIFDDTALTRDFTIFSSHDWVMGTIDAALIGVFTFSVSSGVAGTSVVTATTTDAAANGQGYIEFNNTVTGQKAKIYFVHVEDATIWILADGTWNALGFWNDAGIWNF